MMRTNRNYSARIITTFLLLLGLLFVIPGAPRAQETESVWPPPPSPLEKGFLTETELHLVDLALESINMTWSDMGFRKDYTEDPFRLTIAQKALDDPYFLVQWNYEWDEFLLERKAPSDILYRAANDLDADVYSRAPLTPTYADLGRPSTFPALPLTWQDSVLNLDQAVTLAQLRMEETVLDSLTESELEYLRWYLPCHFEIGDTSDCPEGEDYAPPQEFLDAIESFNLDALVATARELSEAIDLAVNEILPNIGDIDFHQPLALQGDSGTILIGSTGDDIWYMEDWPTASIIIDPGGNDTYYGQVATAGNLIDETNELVALALDFDGNDAYLSDGKRSCASGVLGIAGMIDITGDDVYRNGDLSQASGLFGVGILIDNQGRDIYEGGALVQGAGAIGIGLLLESSGNDYYSAANYAQGMAYTRGWGMLSDHDGADVYYAGGIEDDFPRYPESTVSLSQGFAIGMRPSASGGVGILHDRNGNDFYNAEVYGQGVSYWYSIGALIDDNGNDWYQCQQYSQGSGIHLSAGILLDRDGYDRYSSQACTQGFGHDLAVGWLIDEGGDDYYTGGGLAQGSGNANGVGLLIDRGDGHDGYFGRDKNAVTGHGNLARDYGSIGVFIDMGGPDTYSEELSGDGLWWTKTNWGVGIDVGDDWWIIDTDDEGVEISRILSIPGME